MVALFYAQATENQRHFPAAVLVNLRAVGLRVVAGAIHHHAGGIGQREAGGVLQLQFGPVAVAIENPFSKHLVLRKICRRVALSAARLGVAP